MRPRIKQGRSISLGVLATAGALALATPSHAAAPADYLYDTTVNTTITGLGATFSFGPATTKVHGDLDSGEISSVSFTLPEARSDFKMFGFLPTHAKAKITQVGEMKGTFRSGVVEVSGEVDVAITEVGHFGATLFKYPACKTTKPAQISLKSEGTFDPATGGTLTGTYKLPPVAGCLIDTPVINVLVAGKDNPLSIKLTGTN